MKKQAYSSILLLLFLISPGALFAWGLATHAYFGDKLGKTSGYLNLQEIYGAMAADFNKSLFGTVYQESLGVLTHTKFNQVSDLAATAGLKAFAYGLITHNSIWGADFTAHHEGRTTSGRGYVSVQVTALKFAFHDSLEQILLNNGLAPQQADSLATEYAPSLAHLATELAVDVWIKRHESADIGKKILQSTQLRSSAIPALLVAAYADPLAHQCDISRLTTTGLILGAEKSFQEFVSYYGYMLTKKESELIRLLSIYAANIAEGYFKLVHGLTISVPPAAAANLLTLAMEQVETSYAAEIAATLAYLKNEMPLHQNGLVPQPLALEQEASFESENPTLLRLFSLEQNYPNPFNQLTTISYRLAAASHVRLEIYNLNGQKERTLLDADLPAGVHRVQWDAKNATGEPAASGPYIYRIQITPQEGRWPPLELARQMVLVK
ncbi:MAG: hypothetical protein ONB11_12325 [candidate division KSB1 bacterium]|nr:hypothetical protein [candidate division KSB1 bacterium]MDZ7341822.1 hypothetical protein [candidate division KSB1 bacterium]